MIWKLLALLNDLMPHLTRLVPLLERFGSSGMAPEQIAGMQKGFGDLQNAHSIVLTQLRDQTMRLAALEGRVEELQLSAARLEEQMEAIAHRARSAQLRLSLLVVLMTVLLIAVLAGLALLLLSHRQLTDK